PLAGREALRETGFLSDDRPPRCEIARAPVAKPTGVWPHVLISRDGELAARALNIPPIPFDIFGNLDRVYEPPAALVETSPGSVVNARRQLEGDSAPARQVEELLELAGFPPVVCVASVGDGLGRIVPGGDRRVRTLGRGRRAVPEIHHNGLPRRQPAEALRWRPAILGPEVLAKGEMVIVSGEHVDHVLVTLRHFHLRCERIGFD